LCYAPKTFYSTHTKARRTEHFMDPMSAMCREKQIKKWSRGKKLALAKGDTGLLKQISKAHVSTSST